MRSFRIAARLAEGRSTAQAKRTGKEGSDRPSSWPRSRVRHESLAAGRWRSRRLLGAIACTMAILSGSVLVYRNGIPNGYERHTAHPCRDRRR